MDMLYTKPSEEFKGKFLEIVEDSPEILITSHKNPDDDSISSVLGLYAFLKEKFSGKTIRIMYSSDPRDRWSYFENFEKIEFVPDIADYLHQFNLLICLDGGQHHRFSARKESLREFAGKKVCIDHHGSSPDDFDLSLISPECTSTSEIIYRLFYQNESNIPPRAAEVILLGILGDTGVFQYIKPHQTEIFKIAERLVTAGNINIQALTSRYMNYSERVFSVIREFIDRAVIHKTGEWPPFISFILEDTLLDNSDYTKQEVSDAAHIAIANFGINIKDVMWAVVLYPSDNGDVKIGLRSKPEGPNVRQISEAMGLGGGHDKASGGVFKKTGLKNLEAGECLEKIIHWLKNNNPSEAQENKKE